MIHTNSTVQKKFYNKGTIRVGIENVKVGDSIRAIDMSTLDYCFVKVKSIVKVTMFRSEVTTTTLETILCASNSNFLCLDTYKTWTPSHSYDLNVRLAKRKEKMIYTPFIYSVKHSEFPTTFYDLVIDTNNKAVLVDGYARIFGISEDEKQETEI